MRHDRKLKNATQIAEKLSHFIFPRSETSVSHKRDDKFSEPKHVPVPINPI